MSALLACALYLPGYHDLHMADLVARKLEDARRGQLSKAEQTGSMIREAYREV